jgi:hypothetical protein
VTELDPINELAKNKNNTNTSKGKQEYIIG